MFAIRKQWQQNNRYTLQMHIIKFDQFMYYQSDRDKLTLVFLYENPFKRTSF